MFEEQAKEYEERKHHRYEDNDYCGDIADGIIQAYQQGAQFGYNKFKEELNQKGLALQSDMDETIEQNIALKKENAELKEENTELKTKKIPQLERKIASIRGCHSVAVKKLNARIEQVERLKKENAELRQKLRSKL